MAFTKCWLAYPEIRGCHCDAISLHTELTGETIDRAKAELAEGFKGLYGAALTEGDDITLALDMALDPEGYRLKAANGHCTIEGGSEVGVLYGVFALLRNLQTAGKAWAQFTADEEKAPSNRLRMLNHWDNMDGSIERGYSGDSFFFKDSEILIDVPRLTAYARMLASVGINGITINNVNVKDAASWLITDRYFGALQEYLKIFTPYGVKLYLSINFAAPMELGGMDSADPCDPAVIAGEWLRLTFGNNEPVEKTLHRILMQSWPTYEKYNAPLGVGWMVNPNYHYGPNVDGYEYSRWGCYHRASFDGIGIDRSPTGSDYCHQYAPELAEMYANVETCPEELLLFFHHMPYNYVLKSGKTILQHIYDTHFEGAEDAARFYDEVVTLKPYLDPAVYARLEARFAHQKEHACEWRDVINTYFYRKTGIGDAHGRKIYE